MPMLTSLIIVAGLLSPSAHLTSQNYASWNLLCGEKGNCSLSQLVSKDPEAKQVLVGVNVNFSVSEEFPVMMLRLPPNVYKNGGVGLKIDDHKAIRLPLSQCTNTACQSVIKIDDTLLSEMREGELMKVAFALSKQEQMTLPVSLQGFKMGFSALLDSQKNTP